MKCFLQKVTFSSQRFFMYIYFAVMGLNMDFITYAYTYY